MSTYSESLKEVLGQFMSGLMVLGTMRTICKKVGKAECDICPSDMDTVCNYLSLSLPGFKINPEEVISKIRSI